MDQETSSAQETCFAEETGSAKSDRLAHRMNQILSGIVACAVLGVAGLMAYQNRDSFKAPDTKGAKGGFLGSLLNKKFETATAFPPANFPEFKAPDWEKNTLIDPSKLVGPGNQFAPTQFHTTTSSSSHRRRP